MTAAQQEGVIYAATHVREIEAAESVLSILTWAQTVRFASSSSEMIQQSSASSGTTLLPSSRPSASTARTRPAS